MSATVSAFIATAFAQDPPEAASALWRSVADQIRPKVPKLASLLDIAEESVLAYIPFPGSTGQVTFDKVEAVGVVADARGRSTSRLEKLAVFK